MKILARGITELPDLEEADGEPLDSDWHRIAMNLLIDSLSYHLRQRIDFYCGGNMFVYYDDGETPHHQFRGPDFFFVDGVPRQPIRRYWVVEREGGRFPDVIIELLSPKTRKIDRTTKKDVYEQAFATSEYFLYDPDRKELEGWRLKRKKYQPITIGEDGRMWSERLELAVGSWRGEIAGYHATWLRFFDKDGRIVMLPSEAVKQQADSEKQRADLEKQRADLEKQRADTAEKELRELRGKLSQAKNGKRKKK